MGEESLPSAPKCIVFFGDVITVVLILDWRHFWPQFGSPVW